MEYESGTTRARVDGDHRRPVAIDLFSGAGGLTLGFERAGFDVLSAVEYDPVHAATHLYNFPLTDMLCRDIATVTGDELLKSAERGWAMHYPKAQPWDGVVDTIIGGPSCQGFSTMGKQDVEDERNQLILEFVRLVIEIKPKTFCMENVPGFLDSRFDSLRNKALNLLRKAGYLISGQDKILDAADFGVPQKRKRVFILGSRADSAPVHPVPVRNHPVTVDEALSGLPSVNSNLLVTDSDMLHLTNEARRALLVDVNDYVRSLNGLPESGSHYGHRRIMDPNYLSGCRLTAHAEKSIERFEATLQGTTERVSRAFRLDSARPSRTLRAGTGRERGAFSASRPLHPTEPRVITVREAARIHSFPDWFRFHTTNWHGNRQIGNAVPPLLAQAVAEKIMAHLCITPVLSEIESLPPSEEYLLKLSPTLAASTMKADINQVPQTRAQVAMALASSRSKNKVVDFQIHSLNRKADTFPDAESGAARLVETAGSRL